MAELPFVSVIIPMRNEEVHIVRCLDSITHGDYPCDRMEVLVVDGDSTDRSPEMVREYSRSHSCVRLLRNPQRTTPVALNIGIREARGQVVVWMGSHATYSPNYLLRSVQLLEETGAADVGGKICCVGQGYVGKAIAIAMSSRFGVGDARFRYSDRQEWVDTVFGGCWRTVTLESLGPLDEGAVVNQDYEFNFRLRKAGGRILYTPSIQTEYYVRESLRAFAKQYFRYGFWRTRTLVKHPASIRWRQVVPPALVAGLVFSLLMILLDWRLSLALPVLYLMANSTASVVVARCGRWRHVPALIAAFSVMHIGFGLGFWAGMARFGIPRLSPSRLLGSVRAGQ